jgi:hypothetical protein
MHTTLQFVVWRIASPRWYLCLTQPACFSCCCCAAATAEFHSQGDTSRQQHPELLVADMFVRKKADVPKAQVRLLIC